MTEPTQQRISPEVITAAGVEEGVIGRFGRDWKLRYATVIVGGSGSASIAFDGDASGTPVPAISLVGLLAAGDRVAVTTVPPSGNYITHVINPVYPRLIARGDRDTSSTANSAAQGVLRIDAVPGKAGHLYKVHTSALILFTTVVNPTASARLSYTLDGTAAGTGSALLGIWNSPVITTLADGTGGYVTAKVPIQTTDFTLSVLLFTLRLTGAGNISLFGNTDLLIELFVYDWGPDPGNTGVAI